jgi:hypothetical protein
VPVHAVRIVTAYPIRSTTCAPRSDCACGSSLEGYEEAL